MLAGLLFAIEEAEDRAGVLAATLPFAAATLIEYQARLLAACDATQIIVVVGRLTPELVGAIARIGRRGLAVDTVRTAAEAQAKLHPLARVVMLADGLVTTEDAVAGMAGEGSDALLVVSGGEVEAGYERVGGGAAWAGVARLDARRIAEAAALPADYALQSTLVRLAEQAGARHVTMRADRGHGIEWRADQIEDRGRAVLSASMSQRAGWFDRLVLGPLAGAVIPLIARHGVATTIVTGVAGVAGVAGLAITASGRLGIGLSMMMLSALALEIAAALALFRDEATLSRWVRLAMPVLPVLAALVLGHAVDAATGGTTARLIALGAVVAGGVAERAIGPVARRRWWGTPLAWLALMTLGGIAGAPVIGLTLTALYASATLIAAVETLRRQA